MTSPFGLSLPFDKLRTIGIRPFGLSLSKPFLANSPSTSSGRTVWVDV
jgi:hypothetical protein